MVRVRIPNGLLTSKQVNELAALSDELGNVVADITVRQNVQLHWVKIEDLPELLERLQAVGLRTTDDSRARCAVISASSGAEMARGCNGSVRITESAAGKSMPAISSTALSRMAP